MSINWHYFKAMNKVPRSTIPKTAVGNLKDLYEFTGFKADVRQQGVSGRSWRAEELRLKSHDDLHKLWYVCLKEKNKLKSDWLMSKQMQQAFYGYSELVKVRLSMARLLTVVNERKTLRNSYRRALEDRYIRIKQHDEEMAIRKERRRLEKSGIKLPLREEDVKKLIKAKSEKRE